MANIKGQLKICGGQVCDYIYFTKRGLDDKQAESARSNGVCPPWGPNTVFAITFNNGLIASNANTGYTSLEMNFDAIFSTFPCFNVQMQPVSISFDVDTQKGDIVFNTIFVLE